MKKLFISSLFLFAISAGASAQDSHIKIVNASKWDVDHIYISPVDKLSWGKDLLGDDEILKPGESIEILADCDTYDVRIIDQDGVDCIIEDVNICLTNDIWTIGDLTKCNH